jgi:hypothetical protein
MSVIGECCICGYIGELTFEHVPPRAAYNDRRVFEAKMESLLGGEWIPGTAVTTGRYLQRGAGRHSLCGKCNNDTGAWYGTPYVDFARQALAILFRSKGELSLAYLSFPKILSVRIRAVRQNQRIIQCDVCDHPPACNLHSRSVQATMPA